MAVAWRFVGKEDVLEISADWHFVSDTVMGGVSHGAVTMAMIDGREAARLTLHRPAINQRGFEVRLFFQLINWLRFATFIIGRLSSPLHYQRNTCENEQDNDR